ncbi:MAG: hypothetical protein FWG54_02730 [Bacteroidetes bacterium]|nr:hypothetical protein [Bacteroidota bacterium]
MKNIYTFEMTEITVQEMMDISGGDVYGLGASLGALCASATKAILAAMCSVSDIMRDNSYSYNAFAH